MEKAEMIDYDTYDPIKRFMDIDQFEIWAQFVLSSAAQIEVVECTVCCVVGALT